MKIVPKLQTAWSPLVLQSDNTRVNIPLVIKEEEYKLKPGEYLFVDKNTGDKTILKSKQATLSSDNRSDYQKRRDDERSKRLKRKYEEDKNTEAAMKQLSALGTFYSPSTWVGAATRNNNKSYFDNIASGEGFGDNATNIVFDLSSPFVFTKSLQLINNGLKSRLFIPIQGTYTRGIGRGTEGLEDLIRTGIVRGNPRGTEVTANQFAKLYRKNRFHFRDIINDTGIKDIENKFFSRTLTKEEFDAIKKASKKYKDKRLQAIRDDNGQVTFSNVEVSSDPLINYDTYDDYVKTIQKDVANVEAMPYRIKSGEVKVNHGSNRPIEERFGSNSDYIEDGTPLSYWYADGRNPFSKGHDYAGSNYAVRVNNPSTYQPFMHSSHLHPSFRYSPRLDDPNVEVFRRLPFGLGWKMNKNKLIHRRSYKNVNDHLLGDDAISTGVIGPKFTFKSKSEDNLHSYLDGL